MSDNTTLARRAVASKHWRWMPGMRLLRPDGRFELRLNDKTDRSCPHCAVAARWQGTGLFPDLDDPATIGCLLALAREVHRRSGLNAMTLAGGSRVGDGMGWVAASAETEVEALVLALEAAP